MNGWRLASGRWIAVIGLCVMVELRGAAQQAATVEQKTKSPTLVEILQRLQENLDRYDTGVPSFFCDEHVVSEVEPGLRNQDTVTESVFRLRRITKADHTTSLEESRELKDGEWQACDIEDPRWAVDCGRGV